jgi:GNAT superfamily N-acetyltransferase
MAAPGRVEASTPRRRNMPPEESVSIRYAGAEERLALEDLQRRAGLANAGDREALLANPDAIRLPPEQIDARQVFVADRAGERLGFSVVLPRADGDAELDGLFVVPNLWGSGIGRTLVDHAADHARSLGARILHVIGNPHARGFYLKVGFVVAGECQTQFGPGLLMRRLL